jgi:molybdopterin-guanine dinucleotide biosynthesis protein A
MRIATVILAGGEGSRMGGEKPLRVLGGLTLLDRAMAFARKSNGPIAVAVRHENQLPVQDAELILDEPSIKGPLSGLVVGLGFATRTGAEALLTIPADMPFLPVDLAARLADAIPGHDAAIARSGGEIHPVCGLWLPRSLNSIPAYLATSRRSLKGFAELVGYTAVDWQTDPIDPFLNINVPEDLHAAERLLAG